MTDVFFADLVRELCDAGGVGALLPVGAVPGHRCFADAVPADTTFHYVITGIAFADQWEVGLGRIDGEGRLQRDSVAASSSEGATVDFSPGLKTIALTAAADWFSGQVARSAAVDDAIDAVDTAVGAVEAGLAAKQPLSTLHSATTQGETGDLLVVRRGDDWKNLPLSALVYRGAEGSYIMSGAMAGAAGTAALPSISFSDDANTGFYAPAADTLAVATGGVERWRISAAGNFGIGTTSPDAHLDVERSGSGEKSLILSNTSWDRSLAFCADSGGFTVHSSGWSDASPREIKFQIGPTVRLTLDTSGNTVPGADNAQALGWPSARWATVYAGTGTINTSDAREKLWRGAMNTAELRAAKRIAATLGFYQWNAAVAEKGTGGARFHFGVRAQAVWAVMADEGLVDPLDEDGVPGATPYAFLCFDAWDGDSEEPAGNRFGIRPDELALFLIAGQEARLATLEGAA